MSQHSAKKKWCRAPRIKGKWTWVQLAWCFLKSTELDQGTVLCLWPHIWPYKTLSPSSMNFPVLIVPQGGCLVGGCDIRTPREFTTPEIFKLILLPSSYICKHELQGNIFWWPWVLRSLSFLSPGTDGCGAQGWLLHFLEHHVFLNTSVALIWQHPSGYASLLGKSLGHVGLCIFQSWVHFAFPGPRLASPEKWANNTNYRKARPESGGGQPTKYQPPQTNWTILHTPDQVSLLLPGPLASV